MADIKQVTLPSGDTYDLKDASAVSAVTYSGHTVTVSQRDGTSTTFDTADTTYSDMSGATSSAAGSSGLVPAPSAGDNERYLCGDGTWQEVSGASASSSTPLMDGTGAVGSSDAYARGDHVHPSDTSKADLSMIATAFSTSSTYSVGAYCTYENGLYKCTTAVTTAGSWNSSNWTATTVMAEITSILSSTYLISS